MPGVGCGRCAGARSGGVRWTRQVKPGMLSVLLGAMVLGSHSRADMSKRP